jgi:sarcosine oxidase
VSPVRVVVVGAGVVGLLTAVECVRGGALVELVDRARIIPNERAASYDSHRVVRTLHRGDAQLTAAAAHLHQDWIDVEHEVGSQFFQHTGVLTAMSQFEAENALLVMKDAGSGAWLVSPEELADRYPYVQTPMGTGGIFEPEAGMVRPDRALNALIRWLRRQPNVKVHEHRRVVVVEEHGAVIFEDGDTLEGDRVVVAAGPWSRELLPRFLAAELTLKRQTMLSYVPSRWADAWSGTPAILGLGSTRDAWVMPPIAGSPARMSAHSACRTAAELTDYDTEPKWRDHLLKRFSKVLTDFDSADVVDATEGYYLTDDSRQGPLLAELGDGTVLVYAACGGMSFKFGPAVARALADRALGRTPPRRSGLEPVDTPRRLAATHPERRVW